MSPSARIKLAECAIVASRHFLLRATMVAFGLLPLLFAVLVTRASGVLGSPAGGLPEVSASQKSRLNGRKLTLSGSPIQVYWHAIEPEDFWRYLAKVPLIRKQQDGQIRHQIDVLNKDFAQVGLSFELVKINRVQNSTWYYQTKENRITPLSPEWQMKEALAVKNASVLNIYGVKWEQGVRNFETAKYPPGPPPSQDGILLKGDYIPSEFSPFDSHELTRLVGLWAGLKPTYYLGCDPVNDGIDDTPAHPYHTRLAWDMISCPERQSTCPEGGPEPTDNFMNDVPDRCRKTFTRGQIEHMQWYLRTARGVLFDTPYDA